MAGKHLVFAALVLLVLREVDMAGLRHRGAGDRLPAHAAFPHPET
jgi:hypothetical protein